MTKLRLNHPEGIIIASDGTIQVKMNSGRCRELVFDQHYVRQISRAGGLINQYVQYVNQGLAHEIMFGETPSQEVLDGKRLLKRPMLSITKARGTRFWFGFVARPTKVNSRNRRRILASDDFLDTLGGVAEEQLRKKENREVEEGLFWLIRGKFEDGIRGYTFNSVSALVEFEPGRLLGIKREDASIWDGLIEMSDFLSESGVGSLAEEFVPYKKRPEFTATIRVLKDGNVSVVLYWNGFAQFEETLNVNILAQVSFLMSGLWPKYLEELEAAYQLGEDDDEEGSAS